MPYTIKKEGDCYYVVKKSTGKKVNKECLSHDRASKLIGKLERVTAKEAPKRS